MIGQYSTPELNRLRHAKYFRDFNGIHIASVRTAYERLRGAGRYPLPSESLNTAVCAAADLADDRSELFAEHSPLSEAEMDAAAESGLFIIPNGSEFYALNAQELEQYLAYEDRIAQETGRLSAEDFGVYVSADIDLLLYKAVLDEYGLAARFN